jgi:hypothetical protein
MVYFMNICRFLLCSAALTLLFSAAVMTAAAQEKEKLAALPDKASLQDVQSWLVRAIDQNSAYRFKVAEGVKDPFRPKDQLVEYSDTKITNVKFQGCQISYIVEKISDVSSSKLQTSGLPAPADHEEMKVMFDLKDINLDEISIRETGADSVMSAIIMRTLDYKRVVKIKGGKETGNITVSVASIVVGSNIVERVKDAFTLAITLCQAEK